jgi:glucose/mannose-6-phosphate isomerase
MARAVPSGLSTMQALAAALPAQLQDGFEHGRELALPAEAGPVVVYAAGMGGSGIAAEIARGLIESETRVPILALRGPTSPPSLSARSRVFLLSYSGNTWETLRAYEAAGRANSYRLVITSGGALAEAAVRDRVPLLPVPSGIPPRAAVGYLLGGILGVLDPWFPESNEDRMRRVAARLPVTISSYARTHGPADRLSETVGSRLPFIYAESSFLGVARRWKTQFEENAKRLAVFDEMPELFHNSIVAWDALPPSEAKRYAALLLEWAGEPPLIRQSLRLFERLLKDRGATVVRVPLPAEDRLEALVQGLSLGDHVSLFLAKRADVDPLPFEAITRFKEALEGNGVSGSGPSPPARVRGGSISTKGARNLARDNRKRP